MTRSGLLAALAPPELARKLCKASLLGARRVTLFALLRADDRPGIDPINAVTCLLVSTVSCLCHHGGSINVPLRLDSEEFCEARAPARSGVPFC